MRIDLHPGATPARSNTAFYAVARAGLALTLALGGSMAVAVTTYAITEAVQFVPGTGTVSGGIRQPVAMNSSGKIIGGCSPCTVFDPATATLANVQALADGNLLTLDYGLNAAGQIAGVASVLGPVVRNADGTATVLGTPGGYLPARPLALNDQGVSAGIVRDPAFTDGVCSQRAVQWDATGQPRLLGSLPGTTTPWSVAHGLNRLGQVVGRSAVPPAACGLASMGHAVLFTPTGPKDLHAPSLPPITPGLSSQANAINDQGLAVGWFPTSGTYAQQFNRAIVWNTVNDTFRLVGSGVLSGGLIGINNSGTVVGYEGTNAMVGDATTGTWTDLNTLVPNKAANWLLRKAVAINDAGQIAVEGYDPAFGTIAFVLTPTAIAAPRLAAPSNLIATPVGLTEVRLQWADNANGETGQRIVRCVNGLCSFIAVGPNVTTYSDTAVATGATYTYQVQALLAGADSPLSNLASVLTGSTTPPTTRPLAPTDLFAFESAPGQVSVRWIDTANNESNYSVYRCLGVRCTTFSLIAALGVNTTTFVDTTVRRGTTYTYKVRASNSVGNSAFSSPWSVTTQP
jgi:hypothetical protein